MAAPTDVRVEATSQVTTMVRWTYGGAAAVEVYRSTDGISYSIVTVIAVGTTSYEDTNLAAGTKYWYKLSDDAGSTFSSIVTVWTHGCVPPAEDNGVALPRFTDGADPAHLNDMAQTIETAFNKGNSEDAKVCKACISDGALTIDCSCPEIEVEVDQDINSISILNCDDASTDITFIIPPNTTRAIGGWPKGMGFTGDEGFRAPVAGGTTGRLINEKVTSAINRNSQSGNSKPGTTTRGGKQGGPSNTAAGCQCIPGTNGELTIKVCKPDGTANTGNSMNCSASTKGAKLVACGGRGPYTWSETGTLVLSRTSGDNVTVSPPTNSGSGEAGNAYTRVVACAACGHTAGTTHAGEIQWALFSCADAFQSCSTALGGATAPTEACFDAAFGGPCSCSAHIGHDITGVTPNVECSCTCVTGAATCASAQARGAVQDRRTAPMIAAGCSPCGINASGATVSVTDALGTVTTIVMDA